MIREPQPAAAAALTELRNAHSTELHGESDPAVDTVRHWLDMDGLWIRVAERDGTLVGYLDVTSEDEDAASPTGAVDLYERAGMHVQRRSATWEKAL